MYGICDNIGKILVWWKPGKMNLCAAWQNYKPIMVEGRYEIDQLHQEIMVILNNYSLVVFEFTKEEEEEILLRILKGY